MWNHRLLTGSLLTALLLLAAANPEPAHSSASQRGPPRHGSYPREEPPEDGHRDGCRVCRLAERVGLRMTPLRPRGRVRCAPPEHDLWAARPRGRVRLEDLDKLEVTYGYRAFAWNGHDEKNPHVTLCRGDFVFGKVPVPARQLTEQVTLPSALRERLRGVQGTITWGRADAKDAQALASFWLDPPDAYEKRRMRDLRRMLAREPRWIRTLLEAQLLLDQQFDHGALRAAEAVLQKRAAEPHAVAIVYAAHRAMGLADWPPAYVYWDEVVWPLRKQRDRAGVSCHLEAERRRLPPPRVRRPRGGCGGGH